MIMQRLLRQWKTTLSSIAEATAIPTIITRCHLASCNRWGLEVMAAVLRLVGPWMAFQFMETEVLLVCYSWPVVQLVRTPHIVSTLVEVSTAQNGTISSCTATS